MSKTVFKTLDCEAMILLRQCHMIDEEDHNQHDKDIGDGMLDRVLVYTGAILPVPSQYHHFHHHTSVPLLVDVIFSTFRFLPRHNIYTQTQIRRTTNREAATVRRSPSHRVGVFSNDNSQVVSSTRSSEMSEFRRNEFRQSHRCGSVAARCRTFCQFGIPDKMVENHRSKNKV